MKIAILIAACATVTVARAEFEVFKTMPATTGPWNYSDSFNAGLKYGVNDHTAPLTFGVADGFDMTPGTLIKVLYSAKLTSPFGGTPYCGGDGDANYPANGNAGSSGTFFPSKYMDPANYPNNLAGLVGCFTNNDGLVIDEPFFIGLGALARIPVGATRLQVGLNDDIFGDNSGEMEVEVEGNPVPEPSTLIAISLGALAMRKRRIASSR